VILVDTSVLIDWFRNKDNTPARYFVSIVDTTSWGIADLVLHEMLQEEKKVLTLFGGGGN
jgi:predicted nucleic acid-binding protein